MELVCAFIETFLLALCQETTTDKKHVWKEARSMCEMCEMCEMLRHFFLFKKEETISVDPTKFFAVNNNKTTVKLTHTHTLDNWSQ